MIINANALQIPLADQSVHCIVTSPPYWGLRDYGVSGQLGLERTPEEYISNMVAVFRECWRVLRDDGSLWLNIGDSYAGSGKGPEGNLSKGLEFRHLENITDRFVPSGLKPKDLVGIPWRLAFALQADGWYLRSDIIWSKPNPMPESVIDRPTKSHEYIFLLTKRERYYYDAEAVREPHDEPWRSNGKLENRGTKDIDSNTNHGFGLSGVTPREYNPAGRNRRTVWTIPTAPYKGAHFATFPPALVEPCIKAGTSERGVCPKCGKGWRRVVEHTGVERERNLKINTSKALAGVNEIHRLNGKDYTHATKSTNSWQPACNCSAAYDGMWMPHDDPGYVPYEPIPATVFDPFVGSGTTVKVAYDLGRRGVGLDLSLEYLDNQATTRIHNGHVGRLL